MTPALVVPLEDHARSVKSARLVGALEALATVGVVCIGLACLFWPEQPTGVRVGRIVPAVPNIEPDPDDPDEPMGPTGGALPQ